MLSKKVLGKTSSAASKKLSTSRKRVLAAADAAMKAKAVADADAATHAGPSSGRGPRQPTKVAATAPVAEEVDGLGTLLDVFRNAVEPLADMDETIISEKKVVDGQREPLQQQRPKGHSAPSALSTSTPPPAPTPITYRTFAASLVCEKKFFLMQERPDLMPKLSIGEAVRIDDAAGFNELARRWDRLQFGSKATLIADKGFDEAAAHTEEVVRTYFDTTYASLGEQAPSLTIHRPAFAAPFGQRRRRPGSEPAASVKSNNNNTCSSSSSTGGGRGGNAGHAEWDDSGSGGGGGGHPLLLQARPAVLRYRPKDNQWVILESQAIIDPCGTAARSAQCLQRIHFSMLAFRYWVTQPHIPISVRKRFLSLNLDGITAENLKGNRLQDSANVTAPIDLQRSGILHIRQFLPGPVTLMDCPPQRLVKYVQRLSLEDLLEVDRRNALKYTHGATSAFDVHGMDVVDPAVYEARAKLDAAMQQAGRHANARSTRSLKQKDTDEHCLFECQQHLMEALLRTHTARLVEKAKDAKQRVRWTTFSDATADGLVQSTYAYVPPPPPTRHDTPSSIAGKKAKKGAAAEESPSSSAAVAAVAEPPLMPIVPCFSEHLGPQCSRGEVCPFFIEGKCLPQKVPFPVTHTDNHLFTLPSTAVSRKVVWWAEGMRTVRDVLHRYKQGNVKLSAPQLRYAKAVSEGMVAINPKEIDKFFQQLRYPIFIIDFEAAQFALPPFQKVVAYQSVPFQFSMDVFQNDILTEEPTHYDFLHFGKGHSPNTDPRTSLVDEMMRVVAAERAKKQTAMEASGEMERVRQAEAAAAAAAAAASVGKRGRKPKKPAKASDGAASGPASPYDGCFIAHFASFEKMCLEKLGQLDERHKEAIKSFFFLDTLDLIKKGFIHPNAGGSNSLKKVLPALCPDFQYGVFGDEAPTDGTAAAAARKAGGPSPSSPTAAPAMEDVTGGDESSQKGENAMGVYRLWYHQEGGGTLQDLQKATSVPGSITCPTRAAASSSVNGGASADVPLSKAARDKVWSTLRIQLLEYCSLDTKALYEIMREIWKEKELVKGVPPADKTGWVYTKPTMRDVSL